MSEPERLAHERVYDGKVFGVDRDRVRMPNGHEAIVDIVRHPHSVVLIPLPERGRITLIRQYRYAVNRFLWELPAGSVDPGETPEQAARRECHEEIGQVPDTIVRMAAMHPTPGYCDEEMIFFKLSGFSVPEEKAEADEDEDIEIQVFDVKDVRDMVRRGEITDMKTVVGLTLI